MTKDEKELLKDLSARLPYGVIVKHFDTNIGSEGNLVNFCILDDITTTIINEEGYEDIAFLIESKPYLRSMSSMTEEEMKELKELCSIYIPTDSPTIGFEEYGIIVFTHHLTDNTYSFKLSVSVIDWLNKNMFDYRGLIPKGLAIEVTEQNSPYKD